MRSTIVTAVVAMTMTTLISAIAARTNDQIAGTQKSVTAQEFRLVDASGRLRATLAVNAEGVAVFNMRDRAGLHRAFVSVEANGRAALGLGQSVSNGFMVVSEPDGRTSAQFDYTGRGSVTVGFDERGRPGLGLQDGTGSWFGHLMISRSATNRPSVNLSLGYEKASVRVIAGDDRTILITDSNGEPKTMVDATGLVSVKR